MRPQLSATPEASCSSGCEKGHYCIPSSLTQTPSSLQCLFLFISLIGRPPSWLNLILGLITLISDPSFATAWLEQLELCYLVE